MILTDLDFSGVGITDFKCDDSNFYSITYLKFPYERPENNIIEEDVLGLSIKQNSIGQQSLIAEKNGKQTCAYDMDENKLRARTSDEKCVSREFDEYISVEHNFQSVMRNDGMQVPVERLNDCCRSDECKTSLISLAERCKSCRHRKFGPMKVRPLRLQLNFDLNRTPGF